MLSILSLSVSAIGPGLFARPGLYTEHLANKIVLDFPGCVAQNAQNFNSRTRFSTRYSQWPPEQPRTPLPFQDKPYQILRCLEAFIQSYQYKMPASCRLKLFHQSQSINSPVLDKIYLLKKLKKTN